MVLASGLALMLLAVPGRSEAQISWEAPLACPSASWLERRVDTYLGHTVASEPDVAIAGHVHSNAGGFVLELVIEVGGVKERRQLAHHDCGALVELAASLTAITIDPLALPEASVEVANPRAEPAPRRGVPVQRPQTRPGPATTPPAPIKAPPKTAAPASAAQPLFELFFDPDAPADDRERPRPARDAGDPHTRMLVSASGGLALNLFPNPAPQVRASVGILHGNSRVKLRVELEGGAALAGRFRSASGAAGGDLLAWDVGLRPCGVPSWGIVELRVCAAVGAGQIRARGVGVEPALTRAHPWIWLAVEPGLAVEVHHNVALFVDFGADFSVYRPNFSVSGADAAAYATPIVAGHGRFGVELRFF